MSQGPAILELAEIEEAWLLANRELGKLWNFLADAEEEQHWGEMPDFLEEKDDAPRQPLPPPPPLELPPPMLDAEPYEVSAFACTESAVESAREMELAVGEEADRQFSALVEHLTLADRKGEAPETWHRDAEVKTEHDSPSPSAASARKQVQAALVRGDAVLPVALRGFDPRPLERCLMKLRATTRSAGCSLVFVRSGVPIRFRDEAPFEDTEEGARPADAATACATAPARPYHPMHWLQWTAMPGVTHGDCLVIEPEAHCVCQTVHKVAASAVQWAIASSGHLCAEPFLREGGEPVVLRGGLPVRS